VVEVGAHAACLYVSKWKMIHTVWYGRASNEGEGRLQRLGGKGEQDSGASKSGLGVICEVDGGISAYWLPNDSNSFRRPPWKQSHRQIGVGDVRCIWNYLEWW
jgi:hypothetical protein